MCTVEKRKKKRNRGPLQVLTFKHGKKTISFGHFCFISHSASMISVSFGFLAQLVVLGLFQVFFTNIVWSKTSAHLGKLSEFQELCIWKEQHLISQLLLSVAGLLSM